MKALLNKYDDPRLSECVWVSKCDKVFANHGAEEYGFTVGKEYEILEVTPLGYLRMKNDQGEIDNYIVEYFQKHRPVVLEVSVI